MPDSWIERVREADAEAEARWRNVLNGLEDSGPEDADLIQAAAAVAIAAELRAQRIARRPGAGQ